MIITGSEKGPNFLHVRIKQNAVRTQDAFNDFMQTLQKEAHLSKQQIAGCPLREVPQKANKETKVDILTSEYDRFSTSDEMLLATLPFDSECPIEFVSEDVRETNGGGEAHADDAFRC